MNENKAKEIMKRNPIKGWPEHAELMEAKGYLECLEKAKMNEIGKPIDLKDVVDIPESSETPEQVKSSELFGGEKNG